MQEILLIDSASVFAEVLHRVGNRWITEIVQGRQATLSLDSIGLTVAMSDLYEGIDTGGSRELPEPGSGPPG